MTVPIAAFPGPGGEGFRLSDSGACVSFRRSGFDLALAGRRGQPGWGLRWGLIGAREADPVPESPLPGRIHVLVGDPSRWKKDLPTYGRLVYPEVRPGVDLVLEPRRHGLEYSLRAAAGADLGSLRWRYEGATGIDVIDGGTALRIRTGIGDLREDRLLCYQEHPDGRREILARYEATGIDEYAIRLLGDVDPSKPVTLDPTLTWSSFLGGARSLSNTTPTDAGRAIARDAAGYLYITGYTLCTDIPNTGGFDTGYSGGPSDVFVAKIDPAGPSLVWSSYLGGSDDESAWAVAVDGSSNVFVTGQTDSADFPTTGGFDATRGGATDAFVTKINASGSSLAWSSYLGGSNIDRAWGLTVDAAGDAYVVGTTSSSDFPTPGGFDTSWDASGDGFIAKILSSGSGLAWGSYLGCEPFAVAVDAGGSAHVTGASGAGGLATAGAYRTALTGAIDAFVMKIAPGGGSVTWYTYLGGNSTSTETGRAIRVDGSGNVYVGGETGASDFPAGTTFGTTPANNGAAFVSKVNPTGTGLVWSVLLGDTGQDVLRGLELDASQNVIVVGHTNSSPFPTSGAFQSTPGLSLPDGFVTKIAAAGTSLLWSSYFGGNGGDEIYGVVADGSGNVFVVGDTASSDFNTTGGFDTTFGGSGGIYTDAFVARINAAGSTLGWSSYYGGDQGPGNDQGNAVAVDAVGNVYLTGRSTSLDFPVPGAFDPSLTGLEDVFVSKVNASGAGLAWSTHVGGASSEFGSGIAVDGGGAVYVTGSTMSADFPKVNAFDSTFGGLTEAFVLKLVPAGSALVWSTYVGGSSTEAGRAIALDGSGRVFVVGETSSADLPMAAGGFDGALGGPQDAFLARIEDAGPSLAWTSYLGGTQGELGQAVAVDASGAVFLAGETFSPDFPTAGGFQAIFGGNGDAFVAKVDPTVPSLAWSSFLGGSLEDIAYGAATDAGGNVYLTGSTASPGFPVPGGSDTTFGGAPDAFVARVGGGGTLAWSTFLGGSSLDRGAGIALTPSGAVVVAGYTFSVDFPTAGAIGSTTGFGGLDAFVSALSAADSTLLASTYLGGRSLDQAFGVAVLNDTAFVTGLTTSEDFPSSGGFDSQLGFMNDAFVARLDGIPAGGAGGTGGGGGGGGGGCGLSGAEALALVGLFMAVRRLCRRASAVDLLSSNGRATHPRDSSARA